MEKFLLNSKTRRARLQSTLHFKVYFDKCFFFFFKKSIFFTNDHGHANLLLKTFEEITGFTQGSVVFLQKDGDNTYGNK